MYFSDYHSHSRRSPDGRDEMRDLAGAAVAAGLQELCFTDHVEPVAWGGGEKRHGYDWAALTRDFAAAQVAWGDKIRLRLGAELGAVNRNFALAEQMMAQGPALDFVIGSVHTLSAAYEYSNLFFLEEKSEAECRAVIEDYLGELLGMAKWGQFHVLGHMTLPLRYMNELRGWHMSYDGFEEQVAELLRTLIDRGCGIELNANRGNGPLPGEKWLRLYRDLGGEIITIGSDAHCCADIGKGVRAGQELLQACGFTHFCSFTGGKPEFNAL